ncbi:T9SS type A sorting domain-containing protein [Ekhidna sp.]|uniref:T9SS type A sorting domain-containing protein n=2 Tax=Ekhidna sp. TaxID=2608089 RepID=UPI003C79CD14
MIIEYIMNKQFLILITCGIWAFDLSAQLTISSQGDSYTSEGATIDFTLGELVIHSIYGERGYVTQGFHQSTLSVTEGALGSQQAHEIDVFPNPSVNVLYIKSSDYEHVTFRLYDSQGKIILQNKLTGPQTQVQIHELGAGMYSLILQSGSSIIKSFKLIKSL